MKKSCRLCNKVFKAKLSETRRGGGIYCSRLCWRMQYQKILTIRNKSLKQRSAVSMALTGRSRPDMVSNQFRKGLKPKNAIQKGERRGIKTEFKKGQRSRLGKEHSEETRIKISAFQQGLSKEEWKGFKRSKDYLERRKFQQTIQKSIFERDNYTCQICGARGIALQVDHIQSWSEYIELRFSMENCRTLCDKCHYLITFNKPMPKNIKAWGQNLSKRGGVE